MILREKSEEIKGERLKNRCKCYRDMLTECSINHKPKDYRQAIAQKLTIAELANQLHTHDQKLTAAIGKQINDAADTEIKKASWWMIGKHLQLKKKRIQSRLWRTYHWKKFLNWLDWNIFDMYLFYILLTVIIPVITSIIIFHIELPLKTN